MLGNSVSDTDDLTLPGPYAASFLSHRNKRTRKDKTV